MSLRNHATGWGIAAVERRLVPDAVTRRAIRRLCGARLKELRAQDATEQAKLIDSLKTGPIAFSTDAANSQHYEVPHSFFAAVLGPHSKYSCCYWPAGVTALADAEREALDRTCQHAELVDGQNILELGCGWGALSLWMAERFPRSRITSMSNSQSQRTYIEQQAQLRGLSNLQLITADINEFEPPNPGTYDRIVSVEMFEHLHNYECLFERLARWLLPGGKVFTHVFCHREYAYPFQDRGTSDWMARHFFTGGMMPSADLWRHFEKHLRVTQSWFWSGEHYRRTAEAWLANLDANRELALEALAPVDTGSVTRSLQRWRMFFLAVAELFGYQNGREWFVTHSLLEPFPSR